MPTTDQARRLRAAVKEAVRQSGAKLHRRYSVRTKTIRRNDRGFRHRRIRLAILVISVYTEDALCFLSCLRAQQRDKNARVVYGMPKYNYVVIMAWE